MARFAIQKIAPRIAELQSNHERLLPAALAVWALTIWPTAYFKYFEKLLAPKTNAHESELL